MIYLIIATLTAFSIILIGWLYDPKIYKSFITKGFIATYGESNYKKASLTVKKNAQNTFNSTKLSSTKKTLTLNRLINKFNSKFIFSIKDNSSNWFFNPAYMASFLIILITLSTCYWLINHSSLAVYHQPSTDQFNNQVNLLLAGERLQPPPTPPKELFAQLDAEIQKAQQVDEGYWSHANNQSMETFPNFSASNNQFYKPKVNDLSMNSTAAIQYKGEASYDMLTTHLNGGHINIKNADRNWKKMNSEFVQRLLAVYKIMNDQYGYEMVLLEGYRSPQRQARLLAKGPSVTKAGSYRSYHQFGLAADSAFIKNGKIVISERDPWAMKGYRLYGQVAKSVGLTWGGNWKMMDLGHVQLTKKEVLGRPEMAKIMTSQ